MFVFLSNVRAVDDIDVSGNSATFRERNQLSATHESSVQVYYLHTSKHPPWLASSQERNECTAFWGTHGVVAARISIAIVFVFTPFSVIFNGARLPLCATIPKHQDKLPDSISWQAENTGNLTSSIPFRWRVAPWDGAASYALSIPRTIANT
jgi:hypothetical protein